ncbi:hypothetical protein [Salinigranum sp. GCM10025319]|uniref:hypothetical protein n=1 Tax=Salinigranum sp. GCM10025319 TaxID=3252687 RepID=UPI003616F046
MHSTRALLAQGWRDLLSVYYANTPIWRWMKSGALVLLGLFLWTGANVLHSYRPDWDPLRYVMAYGFVLLAWGPLTHFVVVPLTIRFRRTAERPFVRSLARHASKLNFSTFLLVVVVVGTLAPGVMLLDFSPGTDTGGSTVTADVTCDAGESVVSCRVDVTGEVDHVAVTAGGEVIRTLDDPPYAFEVERSELAETGVGHQFVVELRDADGNTLRRFVQTVPES